MPFRDAVFQEIQYTVITQATIEFLFSDQLNY